MPGYTGVIQRIEVGLLHNYFGFVHVRHSVRVYKIYNIKHSYYKTQYSKCIKANPFQC